MSGLIFSAPQSQAQIASTKGLAETDAVAACERTARQTLASQATRPAEVTFNAGPVLQPSLSNRDQMVLRGEGRWRAPDGLRSFHYSCDVDLHTAQTVGLVLRDSTPPGSKPPPAPRAEPDLSHLSPAACESSAAQALKQRWPRVSQISFDSEMRSFRQHSASSAELHGRGRALPALDAPSTFFGFDCEIDPRDGRVLKTRLSG